MKRSEFLGIFGGVVAAASGWLGLKKRTISNKHYYCYPESTPKLTFVKEEWISEEDYKNIFYYNAPDWPARNMVTIEGMENMKLKEAEVCLEFFYQQDRAINLIYD